MISACLNVSNLCLGTMTFGEQNSYEEARDLLNVATESGINFFDSAEMYPVPQRADSQGRSELYLGRWMKEKQVPRDQVVIATKFDRDALEIMVNARLRWETVTYDVQESSFCGFSLIQAGHDLPLDYECDLSLKISHSTVRLKVAGPSAQMAWIRGGPTSLDAKNIQAAVDGSLKRLDCDYIDLYQLHWPDRYVPMFGEVDYDPTSSYTSIPLEEQLEALSRAKSQGKILHVGISNETAYGVMEFCRLAASNSAFPRILTIQGLRITERLQSPLPQFRFYPSRMLSSSAVRVSLLAYSPLAMGLLSGKYCGPGRGPKDARLNLFRGQYAEAECRYSLSKPNLRAAVSAYVELARRCGLSPVALAIGFVLRNPLVMSAVIGATKLCQLKEIVEVADVKLDTGVMAEINAIHELYPNPTP